MPLYTYKCTNGHEFDELRPMEEREETCPCPTCTELSKLIVSSSVSVKVVGGTPKFHHRRIK